MQGFLSTHTRRELTPVPAEEALAAVEPADTTDERDPGDDGVAWIHLTKPTQDDLRPVAETLRLPPLAVEDALEAHQRAKYEQYGEVAFFVLRTLRYKPATADVESGELMLFCHPRWLVTVQYGPTDALELAHARVAKEPELLQHGAYGLVYVLADAIVDAYLRAVAQLGEALDVMEQEVFTPERRDFSQQIYRFKREVLEFRAAVHPLVPLARELTSPESHERVPAALAPYVRDVADHVLRTASEVSSCDELTDSILHAHSTQAGIWQNEDMRKISGWAAILAAPTLIAGVYGMNFNVMPELHWALGYPAAIAVMLLTSALLYRTFRRNGWM